MIRCTCSTQDGMWYAQVQRASKCLVSSVILHHSWALQMDTVLVSGTQRACGIHFLFPYKSVGNKSTIPYFQKQMFSLYTTCWLRFFFLFARSTNQEEKLETILRLNHVPKSADVLALVPVYVTLFGNGAFADCNSLVKLSDLNWTLGQGGSSLK